MSFPNRALTVVEVRETFGAEVNTLVRWLSAATAMSVLADIQARANRLAQTTRRFKLSAHQQQDDVPAKMFLGMEAHARAIEAEAKMWRNLRRGQAHDAWCNFADAEEWFALAHRTPYADFLFGDSTRRYKSIEELVFPHMMFVSSGFDHGAGKCTICDHKFSSCDHIKGRIYLGQVCSEYGMTEMRADHVAIVEHPQDRRCYIRTYTNEDGNTVDRITGAVTRKPSKQSVKRPESAMHFDCVVFRNQLPFGARL
jgi:hypothetical protein